MQEALTASPEQGSACVVTAGPQTPSIGDAVCAIGVFDGVHRGHRFVIDSMVADAARLGVASVIVTFDIDPDEFFDKEPEARKLLSNPDRVNLLSRAGADWVVVVPFTRELAALPYDEFLEGVLGRIVNLRGIHVGRDFRLGHEAAGTVEALAEWGGRHDCPVHGYDLVEVAGRPVTSTRIRELLAKGDVAMATCLLDRPFYVRGEVVEGRHEGTQMGFPTANVKVSVPYAPVADGVYSGWCEVDGMCLPAAINAGYPPTFEGRRDLCKLEPHILDFDGDLYGKQLVVSFRDWLRDPVKFESVDALEAAVKENIAWTRKRVRRSTADELGFPVQV